MALPPQFADDAPTFWERFRGAIIGALLVLTIGGFLLAQFLGKKPSAPARTENVMVISLPPLPPPPRPLPTPPPPQATPPPVDQKMDEPRPMEPQEAVKPDEAPPKPDTPPDQPMGTNNAGPGPGDNFGLGGGGGGNGGFGGGGKGGSGGSKYGWYAGQVQSRIQGALQQNRRTKNAQMRIEVRIWPDSTGRVTRAELKTSTGDPALDSAIQSEVLQNLQLQEPPPAGMPLPIVLRLTAKRPV